MKIVPVQHCKSGYTYVFTTPKDLHEGDVVLCKTKKGTDIGVCVSDSFEAEGKVLEYILSQSGTSVENMKPVLGVYAYNEFENKSEKPTSETICGIPADTPIDTPVLVWDDEADKRKRYFAGIEGNRIKAFENGATSWSAEDEYSYTTWNHAELATKEDNA